MTLGIAFCVLMLLWLVAEMAGLAGLGRRERVSVHTVALVALVRCSDTRLIGFSLAPTRRCFARRERESR